MLHVQIPTIYWSRSHAFDARRCILNACAYAPPPPSASESQPLLPPQARSDVYLPVQRAPEFLLVADPVETETATYSHHLSLEMFFFCLSTSASSAGPLVDVSLSSMQFPKVLLLRKP